MTVALQIAAELSARIAAHEAMTGRNIDDTDLAQSISDTAEHLGVSVADIVSALPNENPAGRR